MSEKKEGYMRIKQKFINSYPIVNCILVVSSQIFKNIENIIWIMICILSIIELIITLKEEKKAKVSTKIFLGITLVLGIGAVIYKICEVIL